ncbi:hypothetical protein P4601_02165, partial [Peribacillus frigoritolerans]|uniref:hypothetical protein n=1 Tax=Peribacillus frigoritolerans TaxID=450367 RepID=UPI002E1C107A|nr:hypothetical protein [Peribacillus frigoritolerans]
ERKVRDSYGKNVSRGNPAGAKAPRADRPRKASALSGNQRSKCTNLKIEETRLFIPSDKKHNDSQNHYPNK